MNVLGNETGLSGSLFMSREIIGNVYINTSGTLP